jgi:RNA polymerase sigma factor (sigma-70 family)
LISLAHKNMSRKLQRKVDPEDVAQSVLKSVILRLGDGKLDVGDWDGLWGLMVRFTLNRCMRCAEHYRAGVRDLHREAERPEGSDGSSDTSWKLLDREPSPDEAAVLAEALDQILDDFNERDRQIVSLSLEGRDVAEVSVAVGCSESKVYRILARVRQLLQRMNAAEQ